MAGLAPGRLKGTVGWLAPVAVLLVAAYLRLARLDLVQFRWDEAQFLATTLEMLDTGDVPLVGLRSSTGIYMSPLFVYVLALPMVLARDVALASGAVAALNVLAVALCYRVVARYFGRGEALVATLLFGTGFWMLVFSRRVLDVGLTPLAAVLLLGSLLGWAVEGRRWHLAWSCLWLSVGVQFNISFVAWSLPFLVLLVIYRRRVSWGVLGVGAVLAALVAAPPLVWEVTHGFQNLRTAVDVAQTPTRYDLASARVALRLLSTGGFNTGFGKPSGGALAEPRLVELLRQALTGALFAGLGFMALRSLWTTDSGAGGVGLEQLRAERRGYIVLLTCTLLPVVFYVRHSFDLHTHYLLMLYPLPHIALGVGLTRLVGSAARWAESGWSPTRVPLRGMAHAGLAAFVLAQAGSAIWVWTAFLGWIDGRAWLPGYGLPLSYLERGWAEARKAARLMEAPQVYVMAQPELGGVYRLLAREGSPPAVVVKDNRALVLPAEGPAVALSTTADRRAGAALRQGLGHAEAVTIPRPGGENWASVYALPAGESRDAVYSVASTPLGAELRNGVTLERYHLPERATAGGELLAEVVWSVGEAQQEVGEGRYRFFAHLVDSDGRLYGQQDDLGYRPQDWRTGDLVLEWHVLRVDPQAPRGGYWLLVGMYDVGTMARVPFESGDDYVALGPVKVVPPQQDDEAVLAAAQYRREVVFAKGLSLVGYSVLEGGGPDELRVLLFWRCDRPVDADYTVYAHLVDSRRRILSQDDGPPSAGRYPTSLWEAGEVIADERVLAVPEGIDRQTLALVVGWYSLATGERLQVSAGSDLPDGVELALGG